MSQDLRNKLLHIAKQIIEQDNRCTGDPIFLVQGLERIGPIMLENSDGNIAFYDHDMCEIYYRDQHPDEWDNYKKLHDDGELPDEITASAYIEKWMTVQPCFTEEGAKDYIRANGHNLATQYNGIRIYVDSLYRNREMIDIRNALMNLIDKPANTPSQENESSAWTRGYFCAVASYLKENYSTGTFGTEAKSLFNMGGDYSKADDDDLTTFRAHGLIP
jgi:hypothetical protein